MSFHKGLRTILITAAVIAVFGIGIFVLSRFVPEREPEASASPTPNQEVVYIVRENSESMTSLEMSSKDGEYVRVDYSVDSEGKLKYAVEPPATYFAYNTSKFRSMKYTTSSITAKSVVERDAKDLAKYGLEEPNTTMTLTYSDGKRIRLYVGDPTPVDLDYYFCTDQSNDVYTIGSYLAGLLKRGEREYRSVAAFPTYTEEEIYTNIDWVRLTKRDGTTIEIQGNAETNTTDNIALSFYMLRSPVVSSGNDDAIRKAVMDVVAKIQYINIDRDIDSSQLREYGLDSPAKLELRDTSGNMLNIVVGKKMTNGNYFYCADADQYKACIEAGEPLTILLYGPDAFAWLDINYITLISRTVWNPDIPSIHNVSAIDYAYHGESYRFEITEYDDVTESGVDVVRSVGKLGDMDIGETDLKRLYGRTLNLRTAGDVAPGTELGEPEYIVTLTLKSGGVRRLELIKMNDRQYAVRLDGVADHYIYAQNIGNITDAIERIKDGRPLALVYYT
jgi:hypothetical protein